MYQNTSPLVSIVIPCYKQAHYLKDSVGSVLAQTHQHWELIIVDDGSPDDTAVAAQQLINENPTRKIRLVRKPNGGLSDARNAGVAVAEGAWILPLDCDDILAPTYFEKAFELAMNIPTGNLVYANLQQFGAGNDQWIPHDFNMSKLMARNLFPYASMYKKELWTRSGGYERALPWAGEDYSFWLSCGKLGIRPLRIWDRLFLYRISAEGSMFTKLMEHWTHVEPMIHTLHADVYPSRFLLVAHELIGTMHPDTYEVLQKKISRFPELAFPHLWIGLKLEREQQYEAAIEHYRLFSTLYHAADWQGVWRELVCRVRLGDVIGAQLNYEELSVHFPTLIWIRDAWSAMREKESAKALQ